MWIFIWGHTRGLWGLTSVLRRTVMGLSLLFVSLLDYISNGASRVPAAWDRPSFHLYIKTEIKKWRGLDTSAVAEPSS